MRLYQAVTLFVAACVWGVAASPVLEASTLLHGNQKCDRMFPWMGGEGVRSCTYTCRGWPIRYENEPDGVSCQGIGINLCLNGECVDVEEYVAAQSDAPLPITYETAFVTVPTTSQSPASPDAPSEKETTITGSQTHRTVQEWTTHRPTLWQERPFTSVDRVAEETVTSSSFQATRSSSSTEDTNRVEMTLGSTPEAVSDAAANTTIAITWVHKERTPVDDSRAQASTIKPQHGVFTEGSTTVSRRPVTSSVTSNDVFTSSPTHADVHLGTVTDEVPVMKLSTMEEESSTYESTVPATSTSKQSVIPSGIPGKTDPASEFRNEDGSTPTTSPETSVPTTIGSTPNESRSTSAERNNESDFRGSHIATSNDFIVPSATKSTLHLFTSASSDREQPITELGQEDTSVGSPTMHNHLLHDSSWPTQPDVFTLNPTTLNEVFTSYAQSTTEGTLSTTTNTKFSSSEKTGTEAAASGGTSKSLSSKPTFTDPTFTTYQDYAYPDKERSTAVTLHEIISTSNQTTPQLGHSSSSVSVRERSASTSVRGEWPSRTEKHTPEEGSTNNIQVTTIQNVEEGSPPSTPGYYTEWSSSSDRVQTISTTSIEDESTRASESLPSKVTTSSLPSVKEANSTPAHAASSSTEMPGRPQPERSTEEETATGKFSIVPVSAASKENPGSTTSPNSKAPSATQEQDNSTGSTPTRLHDSRSHLGSKESKSDSTTLRVNAVLCALCTLSLFITLLI